MITCRELVLRGFRGTLLSRSVLTISDGEVVGIIAGYGDGGSTFLRTLAGLAIPASGEVRLDDKKPSACPENIAYLSERADGCVRGWYPAQHDSFLSQFYPEFSREIFYHLLELLDIPQSTKVGRMTVQQRRRLELALGFSKGTGTILMDGDIWRDDPEGQTLFTALFREQLYTGQTVLMTVSSSSEAAALWTRRMVLSRGCLTKDDLIACS